MAATMTISEASAARRKAVEANRRTGVTEYKSGQKQSERVFEVREGYKTLPGGIRLGPGQRFHPTEKQVASGALRGKAEEITESDYSSLSRTGKVFAGADFTEMAINAVPMAESTRAYAIHSGLTAADFDGVEAEGANGRFTRTQVERMVDDKYGSRDEDSSSEIEG